MKKTIEEIEEDLEDGLITKDTVINIVRNREMQIDNTGYHPIIDYYLPDDLKMLEEPLEEFYNNTEDIPRLCRRRVLSFRSVGVQSPTVWSAILRIASAC